MQTLEELRRFFGDDHFAIGLGITIEHVDETGAVCGLEVKPSHMNAQNSVQGGVLFTMADFAFAVAANATAPGTVTLNAGIHYLLPARGGRLAATARLESHAGRVSVYRVEVTGENGALLALMTATGYTKAQRNK